MQTPRRMVFAFRYRRRGRTKLWDLDGATDDEFEAARFGPWPGPGARLDPRHHDEKLEWINVFVELDDDDSVDEARDDAEGLADAEFERRHPGEDLAD